MMFARCVLVVLSITTIANGADFYVSTDGDDAGAGSADAPFATIARAQHAVRQRIAAGDHEGDIVVEIAGGRYELAGPIVFESADGDAAADRAVIYEAAKGATPVFSGGRVIHGWKAGPDGVWRTTIPAVRDGEWKFNELFVNGKRAIRARHPNADYLRVEKVGEDKRTNFTHAPGDLTPLADAAPMQLVFLHDWSISRVAIKSIHRPTRTLTTKHNVGPKANHYRMDHYEKRPRYFVENHASLLDAPGEWFLDTNTGELAYVPRKGETVAHATAIAPKLTRLVTFAGQPGAPVRGVWLRGLTFEHCAYDPGERYAAGQAAFHEEADEGNELRVPTPAAIRLDDARLVSLANCRVRHAGGSGVWIGQRCDHVLLSDTRIYDTGGNGIMIGQTDRPDDVTHHVTVTRSLVEHVGQRFFGSVGVWIGMANHCTVEHSVVRNVPYTGISVGWKWDDTPTPCHHHTIVNNHIHHCMQALSDGGGIYTLGRQPGTRLAGNLIHDIPLNTGRAESNGMFLDQGTSELVIENNTLYATDRSSLRFHQAKKNLVRRNTFVLPEGTPPVRYNNTPVDAIELEDNRVVRPDAFDATAAKPQALIKSAGPAPRDAD